MRVASTAQHGAAGRPQPRPSHTLNVLVFSPLVQKQPRRSSILPLFILPLSIFPSNKHLHTPLVTGGSSCACSSSEARLLAQQQLQAAVHLLAAVFGRQHHLDVTSGPGTCSARRAQPIPHSIRACPTPRDSNILRSRRSARSGGVGYSRIRVAIISDTMRRSSPSSFSCHTATSATSKADSLTSA